MGEFNKFIETYLKRGFGSMNKNDFEVAIFNYLITKDENFIGKSSYELSIALKIPISKIKRLKYEAELKYPQTNYAAEIKKILGNAQFRGTRERVSFAVEDTAVRKYLENLLKQNGSFLDSSFNAEIVTIYTKDLPILWKESDPSVSKFEIICKVEKDTVNKIVSVAEVIDLIKTSSIDELSGKFIDLAWPRIKKPIPKILSKI